MKKNSMGETLSWAMNEDLLSDALERTWKLLDIWTKLTNVFPAESDQEKQRNLGQQLIEQVYVSLEEYFERLEWFKGLKQEK